ncbi:DUF3857 domain-containing protein [Pelagicoccus sp. SDUM812003]|uniref:DUF3857 domain-containing protein n=1 Tax=Pelagicoccus sp. SDUM812003 TaxID=3041267 RepID=UPI0028105C1D|nr:DUF3857 domain-containing protein [Pelagicoccus sp. SDUM812003]MDQ8203321.1 DUF3857 domain-containing protein [Pelagicoccus sp. SDUM812003]
MPKARVTRFVFVFLISTCGAMALNAKPKLPDWVENAMALPEPPLREDETPGYVVLWDEAFYNVQPNGRIQRTVRYAIRILDLKERWRAKAIASYYESSDTRPKMKAWTIHADGEIYKYKRHEEELITQSDYLTLETESRTIRIDGWNHTRRGDVFAFEYEYMESSVFTQYYWRFQSNVPVAYSSLHIATPPGWTIRETFKFGQPECSRSGTSYRWTETNVESKDYERQSPTSVSKFQHMYATVLPPQDASTRFTNLRFDTWRDLADFEVEVCDPKAVPSPEIVAKARALTEGLQTDWERIKAIGRYAQGVNYEHVALELGNGGGYTPRSAQEVFRSGYGDCKDKSTLLRSLLQAVGIESYVVSLNATDNDMVDVDLPSPHYFNHCIAAVEVDESVDVPAVGEYDGLGRILFIDPTWIHSPIGEIPFEGQGGLVVVGKRGVDPLVRLPLSSPEQNRLTRKLTAELLPNGILMGRVETVAYGQSAVEERRLVGFRDRKEYLSELSDRYAASGNPSPVLKIVHEEDRKDEDRSYRFDVDFAFKNYARRMQDVLMIFKPAILGRMMENPFPDEKRLRSIRLRAEMLEETATIYLPVELALEEYEKEIRIETDFGSYLATIEEGEDVIKYTRTFRLEDLVLPVERYDELRDFYMRVVEAEQTPVVLSR